MQKKQSSSSLNYVPEPYMKRGIKFLLEHAASGLLLDPGLGKTGITLAAYRILKKEGLVDTLLVVAPRRPAHHVWPREIKKWAEFSGFSYKVLHGPKKDKLFFDETDITIVNIEGLEWLMDKVRTTKKRGQPWPWDMLAVDESSKFKNTQTKRFKNLRPHLGKFKRRTILTGSPSTNGLLNLFGQVYILDMGNALGGYITNFRNNHFDATGYGGYSWKLREGHDKLIYDRVKPLVLRMSAEEYLKLPPLSYYNIVVPLPEQARTIYEQMEQEMFTLIDENPLAAFNAGTAIGKCRQIAAGAVYMDVGGKRVAKEVHKAKLEALEDLVDELEGKPVMVSYEFGHELERLRHLFGKNTPAICGGLSDKEQMRIEDAWNSGDTPVLLVQPQSAAHGLNLQDAPESSLIFFAMLYDLELYEQLIRRMYRKGRKDRVRVYHLLAERTVDFAELATLNRKDRAQKALLKGLQEYRRSKRAGQIVATA